MRSMPTGRGITSATTVQHTTAVRIDGGRGYYDGDANKHSCLRCSASELKHLPLEVCRRACRRQSQHGRLLLRRAHQWHLKLHLTNGSASRSIRHLNEVPRGRKKGAGRAIKEIGVALEKQNQNRFSEHGLKISAGRLFCVLCKEELHRSHEVTSGCNRGATCIGRLIIPIKSSKHKRFNIL